MLPQQFDQDGSSPSLSEAGRASFLGRCRSVVWTRIIQPVARLVHTRKKASSDQPVADWLWSLKAYSRSCSYSQCAARAAYQDFLDRLIGLARARLACYGRSTPGERSETYDGSRRLLEGIRMDRLVSVDDEQDLWLILMVQADRAMVERARQRDASHDETGGGAGQYHLHWQADATGSKIVGPEPTLTFAAQILEEIESSLNRLDEASQPTGQVDAGHLKTIAVMRLQRYTNREIAHALGCVERTVDRRIAIVKRIWESRRRKTSDGWLQGPKKPRCQ
jgi:hypothetical protein